MREATGLCWTDLDRLGGLEAGDLRRRRTRELSEHVLRCATFAGTEDRALVQGVYGEGLTAVQVAQLVGKRPRAVRRRLRRLVDRFVSPRFVYVLAWRGSWPTRRRAIATACVLQGKTMREAAVQVGTSLHVVRKELGVVEALVEAELSCARAGRGEGA